MKIALLQMDLAWCDAAENAARASALMDGVEADLYVLPEMWASGFVVQPTAPLAAASRRALRWMEAEARRRGAALCGTLLLDSPGGFRNRACFVAPEGLLATYDKRHLFRPGGEAETYAAGRRRRVVEWRGVRMLLLTCYDLRFPVFARNRGDYDVLLCMASWPAARQAAWDVLCRARAVENQCAVVAVNRVGSDPSARYVGGSVGVDARGEVRASAGSDGRAGAALFEFRPEEQAAFRQKFPAWADADAFTLR